MTDPAPRRTAFALGVLVRVGGRVLAGLALVMVIALVAWPESFVHAPACCGFTWATAPRAAPRAARTEGTGYNYSGPGGLLFCGPPHCGLDSSLSVLLGNLAD